jgi:hypothetical protein
MNLCMKTIDISQFYLGTVIGRIERSAEIKYFQRIFMSSHEYPLEQSWNEIRLTITHMQYICVPLFLLLGRISLHSIPYYSHLLESNNMFVIFVLILV